ncbi:MAG: tRNA (guanosine(37)-N1)-methyltransferase TrmD [Gammaproteobacteria bacterium]|nr:tRNA (guanosine(37)-N1)-methyltransferase TrmD [Gammaproteobacteria bacterium]
MHFGIVTLFPEMFNAISTEGVVGRAVKNGQITFSFFHPRDFADNRHRTVDDRPYGGGPGMLMMAEPLARAIDAAKAKLGESTPVVYLSPAGSIFKQADTQFFLQQSAWILLCGRYEGVDQRLIDHYVDYEISIGEYVLSGGELPAMVIIDAVARHIPGVLGHAESAEQESYMNENVLDHPHYTRPEVWRGESVPEVLLSGDHQKIALWRKRHQRKK